MTDAAPRVRRWQQAHLVSHPAGTLPAMVAPFPHFSPHRAEPRPCWHCASFGGMIYGGTAARCDRPGGVPVQAGPATGCAFWVREVGADDEPGPPRACVTLAPGAQGSRLPGHGTRPGSAPAGQRQAAP